MPVIGFGFNKINAEKMENFKGDEKVQNHVKIKDLEEAKINIGKDEKEALTVLFEYLVDYGAAGKIELQGHILYYDSPEAIKEFIKSWKKDKKTTPQFTSMIYNFVIARASVKSFSLEEDIGLPIHMSMPQVGFKPREDK